MSAIGPPASGAPGRFITLEGIEGAGKSTVAATVRDWLTARGITVHLTREPGGTALAERVRRIALEPGDEQVSAVAEVLLMFAAREIHLRNLIRPALARGEWVVCDRFSDASRAYQGGGRGIPGEWIEQLVTTVHGDLEPDLTLLLDLPVATGLARARGRSSAPSDRFEQESVEFFERVRAAYLELARREPGRIRVLDASQPLPHVERAVLAELERFFERT